MGVPSNVARPIMSFRGFSTINYVAEPRKMMHSSFVEYDYPCGGPVSVNRYQECAIPAGQPRRRGLFDSHWSLVMSQVQRPPKKRTPRGPNLFKRVVATRACKAALAAGLQIERLEIDALGRVSVVVKNSAGGPVPADEVESWLSKQPKGQNANSR
jgi:hypothetical protein